MCTFPASRILMQRFHPFINAPFITEEEERKEEEELSEAERCMIRNDIYGIHPNEGQGIRDDELARALARMDEEIKKIHITKKREYLEALASAPELIETESPNLAFLQSEKFDTGAAAQRLVSYWLQRKKAFGNRKAFLPLRLDGAMKEDMDLVKKGVIMQLPDDENGRKVLLLNRARIVPSAHSHEAICRLFLFFSLKILKGDTAAKGVVFICNSQRLDVRKHMDRALKKKLTALWRTLPFKIKAFHFVTGPGRSSTELMLPMIKHVHGRYMRLRCLLHSGSREEVTEKVKEFGINEEHISVAFEDSLQQEQRVLEWITRLQQEADKESNDTSKT